MLALSPDEIRGYEDRLEPPSSGLDPSAVGGVAGLDDDDDDEDEGGFVRSGMAAGGGGGGGGNPEWATHAAVAALNRQGSVGSGGSIGRRQNNMQVRTKGGIRFINA